MSVKGDHVPGTPEYADRTKREADDERRRKLHEQSIERAAWANLKHVYERCVSIAEDVWDAKLQDAAAQQQTLAEQMRDRESLGDLNAEDNGATMTFAQVGGGSIPVPLFTPRDRAQFIKEVSTTLLISADRRNLTAAYKESPSEAPKADVEGEGIHEAASAADETNGDETELDAPGLPATQTVGAAQAPATFPVS